MSSALSPWLVLLAVIAGCVALAVGWWRRQGRDARDAADAGAALDLDLGALPLPDGRPTPGPHAGRAAWTDTVPAARPPAFIEPGDDGPAAAPGRPAPPPPAPRRRRDAVMPPFAQTGSPGL